jgi:hypothetical protein
MVLALGIPGANLLFVTAVLVTVVVVQVVVVLVMALSMPLSISLGQRGSSGK